MGVRVLRDGSIQVGILSHFDAAPVIQIEVPEKKDEKSIVHNTAAPAKKAAGRPKKAN